ncbi:type II toxin-antitoxin system PemK/MazF family toxin [Paenibacillus sp. LK1]|uniref:type II toxin-antitoxin system PemK/MazF family toxin n=1 Tax=Paenibacillus sp. LK1 TaxID=2053014 RepID=UPI000C186E91|nr:type II toxin-antitoxin system PemK/MazF family toxin [Paenibacillus sp. LK1]PIH61535.1 PemK family transcriptional regulator [Paenibacillus sp. LK1]
MSLVMERRGAEAKTIKRMEVWEVDLPAGDGSVQGGHRPCVVISNDMGNKYSPVVIVVPLTSSKLKKRMPTHVFVDANECGVFNDSTALCEQVLTVKKERLQYKIFEMPKNYIGKIRNAINISLSL